MSQNITIQINSVEALERLIGDDPQLLIAVRDSAISEFSRRYIKNLIDRELVQSLEEKMKYALIENLRETEENWSLDEKIISLLGDKINKLIESKISSIPLDDKVAEEGRRIHGRFMELREGVHEFNNTLKELSKKVVRTEYVEEMGKKVYENISSEHFERRVCEKFKDLVRGQK